MIDAHQHFWDLSVRDQPWISGPDLAPLRRSFGIGDLAPLASSAGVTGTVLVQTVTVAEETPELLAIALAHPLAAGVVGWLDLSAPEVADTVASLRELPGGSRLAGIRHQVQSEPDPDWLLRPAVLRGLAVLADCGLAYDLVITPGQLAASIGAASAVPGLTFVLDHLAKPPVASGSLEPWASDVRRLAALPNTVCKLSGLVTEAGPGWKVAGLRPYADVVLDAFGPSRLMFGSDWPVCTLVASYREVIDAARSLTSGLSEGEVRAVFEGTARRVYGL
jgi:L-fuconolactonase